MCLRAGFGFGGGSGFVWNGLFSSVSVFCTASTSSSSASSANSSSVRNLNVLNVCLIHLWIYLCMCTGMKPNQPSFSSSSGGGAVAVAVGFDAVRFCTCAGVAPGGTLLVAKKVNQLL